MEPRSAEGETHGPAASPSEFRSEAARWDAELRIAEQGFRRWHRHAAALSERYTLAGSEADEIGERAPEVFNILHSNVQTLLPAVFGKAPLPVVVRRHRDPDVQGRLAASLLQRALRTEIDDGVFADTMRRVALDLLICGRGVPWVRFEPRFAPVPGNYPDTHAVPGTLPPSEEEAVGATSPADYVLWNDFLHSPRNTWQEVARDGWVARRVAMTREQGLRRFGEAFRDLPLHHAEQIGNREGAGRAEEDDMRMRETFGRAFVWEIWDATTRTVFWICRDHLDAALDRRPDPLGLEGFFPCPEPAYGTRANNSLVPSPDYLQYERLAHELDDQTRRISCLTSALRAAGIYDASVEELGRLLADDGEAENEMIPVSNWSALSGQGIENVVSWLPLKAIAEALVGLYDARDRTKQLIYEISGLSDIMRGQVDPREKLGQSRLKGQFASQRIRSKVMVMEACARDVLRIKAEIMAEHYDPEWLRSLSGFDFIPEVERIRRNAAAAAEAQAAAMQQQAAQGMPMMQMPPDPQAAGQAAVDAAFHGAVRLLADERMRGFRLDIETDSTLIVDNDEERKRRMEFLEAAGNFLERTLPVAVQAPQLAPLMGELTLFGIRSFQAGRQLEDSFEEAMKALRETAAAPPQANDGEAQARAAADQAAQAKAAADMQATEMDARVKLAEAQARLREISARTQAGERKAAIDERKAEIDLALTQAEIETKLAELEIERKKLEMQLEAERQKTLLGIAAAGGTPQAGGDR